MRRARGLRARQGAYCARWGLVLEWAAALLRFFSPAQSGGARHHASWRWWYIWRLPQRRALCSGLRHLAKHRSMAAPARMYVVASHTAS